VAHLFGFAGTLAHPGFIPEVSFTWWAMIGALVVFCVGALFRTPDPVLESAARHAHQAQTGQDVPVALREAPPERSHRSAWPGRHRTA
jgi:solute:Na+ symporter, SSS family